MRCNGSAPDILDGADKFQVFIDGHVHVQRRLFRKISDASFDFPGVFENIISVQQNRARCGGDIPGDDIHGGGLAGTVPAQEAENFTFPDRENGIIHGKLAAIPLGYMLDFDHKKNGAPFMPVLPGLQEKQSMILRYSVIRGTHYSTSWNEMAKAGIKYPLKGMHTEQRCVRKGALPVRRAPDETMGMLTFLPASGSWPSLHQWLSDARWHTVRWLPPVPRFSESECTDGR